MKINTEILDQLKVLCHNATHPKVWISAALVHRNKIISYGVNQMKTHPYQSRYSRNQDAIYWHAETSAIYTADRRLRFKKIEQCSLYIARIKYDSTDKNFFISGLAAPCDGCMRCIRDYGIRTIIYTLDQVDGCSDNFGVLTL